MDRDDLERLLTKDVPDLNGKNLWVWGAGNTALLYQNGLHLLEQEGMKIEGYCDRNPIKQGTCLGGKPIISPEELFSIENLCVLICTPQPRYIGEIREYLLEREIENYLFDEVVLKQHCSDVLECYDSLEDKYSQKVYAEVVYMHVCGRDPEPWVVTENEYFAHERFMQVNGDEVFIDIGAYVGDTIETYISKRNGIFGKIIAFEPDKNNYAALEQTVSVIKGSRNMAEEKIRIYPYALAEKKMYVAMDNEHQGTVTAKIVTSPQSSEDGEAKISCVSLDDFLREPCNFLKIDIEGYEYKMLIGAKETIQKNKPIIACCLYHCVVDLYTIPLFLKKIVPDYCFAVRHHAYDLSDTVLYVY